MFMNKSMQSPSTLISNGYKFETTLPYPLRMKAGEVFQILCMSQTAYFVHVSRDQSTPSVDFNLPDAGYIAADRYGIFYRSRIAVILDDDLIKKMHSLETDEVQRIWSEQKAYVGFMFGSPTSKLTYQIVELINRALASYRIVCEEWHAAPVVPKDLASWIVSRVENKSENFLQTVHLSHQFLHMNAEITDLQIQLLQFAYSKSGKFGPLWILEADIHDRITQGDFYVAIVLIAMISEEAIKSHLIQFLIIRDGLSAESAQSALKKKNGYSLGIADLIDPPKKHEKCFVEEISGWCPHIEESYKAWNKDVRELRNEVIHTGRRNVSSDEIDAAWTACCAFIRVSFSSFLFRLIKDGYQVSESDSTKFYNPISDISGSRGLFGKYNHFSS
jgi:hypothetical protein